MLKDEAAFPNLDSVTLVVGAAVISDLPEQRPDAQISWFYAKVLEKAVASIRGLELKKNVLVMCPKRQMHMQMDDSPKSRDDYEEEDDSAFWIGRFAGAAQGRYEVEF